MQPKLIATHGYSSYNSGGPPIPSDPVGVSDSGTAIAIPLAIIGAAVVVVLGLRNKKS